MTTPQKLDPNRTYKIQRITTEGWTDVDVLTAVNLTKEQCDLALKELVESEGIDPRHPQRIKKDSQKRQGISRLRQE